MRYQNNFLNQHILYKCIVGNKNSYWNECFSKSLSNEKCFSKNVKMFFSLFKVRNKWKQKLFMFHFYRNNFCIVYASIEAYQQKSFSFHQYSCMHTHTNTLCMYQPVPRNLYLCVCAPLKPTTWFDDCVTRETSKWTNERASGKSEMCA